MFAFAIQSIDDGLTLTEVVTDIPHDFSALVVYLILGLFIFFIWWGSRPQVIERYGVRHGEHLARLDAAAGIPTVEPPVPPVTEATVAGVELPTVIRRKQSRRAVDPARIGWIG